MSSVVILMLLYIVLLGKSTIYSSQMINFRDKNTRNAILSRKSRTTSYSPYQSGMSVSFKLIKLIQEVKFFNVRMEFVFR